MRAELIAYVCWFPHVSECPTLCGACQRWLHRMASETGGTYFEVTDSQSIEDIYSQIEEALRNQYSIGYTPGRSEPDGKYHKIKLTTKDRHLIVNSRAGYYAK